MGLQGFAISVRMGLAAPDRSPGFSTFSPMTDTIHLHIADVSISFTWDPPEGLEDFDPHYRSFCNGAGNGQKSIPVHIHPQLPESLDIGELERIYASGQTWSLFRRRVDHFLVLDPPEFKKDPLCVAWFRQPIEEVEIFYNPRAFREWNGRRFIPNPWSYPLDRLLMSYFLAEREGTMMHAAGVDIDGKGYIFSGKSGNGKSTLSRQFLSKKGPVVLNDERVAVRKINGEIKTFGTPWPGDAEIAVNRGLPLSGIFFIHHGTHNRIREIDSGEAVKRLLPLATIPWYDPEMMTKTLLFCEDLISHVPSYDLHFTPDGVVDVMEEFASYA